MTPVVKAGRVGHHHRMLPPRLSLQAFPQLHAIAWHCRGMDDIAEDEAFALYEAHWRYLDTDLLDENERALIDRLAREYGGGLLNV